MGFIMSKGPGTDEIIDLLNMKFGGTTRLSAAELALLGPGGSLLDAATALGIMPTVHPNKWRKWLRWIERHHKSAHDEIRNTLHTNMKAVTPVPTFCNWIEDASSSRPRVDAQAHIAPGGGFVSLVVLTKKADNLPDDTPKKKKAVKKKAKKKSAKKKKS